MRFATKKFLIFFEVRATPCRVNNNHIAVIWFEHIYVMPGKLSPSLGLSCMDMQRSTTLLLHWRNHLAAVGSQDTNSCFIDVTRNLVNGPAADEAHAIVTSPQCWCDLWQWSR